jgi:hypothetical protein
MVRMTLRVILLAMTLAAPVLPARAAETIKVYKDAS